MAHRARTHSFQNRDHPRPVPICEPSLFHHDPLLEIRDVLYTWFWRNLKYPKPQVHDLHKLQEELKGQLTEHQIHEWFAMTEVVQSCEFHQEAIRLILPELPNLLGAVDLETWIVQWDGMDGGCSPSQPGQYSQPPSEDLNNWGEHDGCWLGNQTRHTKGQTDGQSCVDQLDGQDNACQDDQHASQRDNQQHSQQYSRHDAQHDYHPSTREYSDHDTQEIDQQNIRQQAEQQHRLETIRELLNDNHPVDPLRGYINVPQHVTQPSTQVPPSAAQISQTAVQTSSQHSPQPVTQESAPQTFHQEDVQDDHLTGGQEPQSTDQGDLSQNVHSQQHDNKSDGNKSDGNKSDGNKSDGNKSDGNKSDENQGQQPFAEGAPDQVVSPNRERPKNSRRLRLYRLSSGIKQRGRRMFQRLRRGCSCYMYKPAERETPLESIEGVNPRDGGDGSPLSPRSVSNEPSATPEEAAVQANEDLQLSRSAPLNLVGLSHRTQLRTIANNTFRAIPERASNPNLNESGTASTLTTAHNNENQTPKPIFNSNSNSDEIPHEPLTEPFTTFSSAVGEITSLQRFVDSTGDASQKSQDETQSNDILEDSSIVPVQSDRSSVSTSRAEKLPASNPQLNTVRNSRSHGVSMKESSNRGNASAKSLRTFDHSTNLPDTFNSGIPHPATRPDPLYPVPSGAIIGPYSSTLTQSPRLPRVTLYDRPVSGSEPDSPDETSIANATAHDNLAGSFDQEREYVSSSVTRDVLAADESAPVARTGNVVTQNLTEEVIPQIELAVTESDASIMRLKSLTRNNVSNASRRMSAPGPDIARNDQGRRASEQNLTGNERPVGSSTSAQPSSSHSPIHRKDKCGEWKPYGLDGADDLGDISPKNTSQSLPLKTSNTVQESTTVNSMIPPDVKSKYAAGPTKWFRGNRKRLTPRHSPTLSGQGIHPVLKRHSRGDPDILDEHLGRRFRRSISKSMSLSIDNFTARFSSIGRSSRSSSPANPSDNSRVEPSNSTPGTGASSAAISTDGNPASRGIGTVYDGQEYSSAEVQGQNKRPSFPRRSNPTKYNRTSDPTSHGASDLNLPANDRLPDPAMNVDGFDGNNMSPGENGNIQSQEPPQLSFGQRLIRIFKLQKQRKRGKIGNTVVPGHSVSEAKPPQASSPESRSMATTAQNRLGNEDPIAMPQSHVNDMRSAVQSHSTSPGLTDPDAPPREPSGRSSPNLSPSEHRVVLEQEEGAAINLQGRRESLIYYRADGTQADRRFPTPADEYSLQPGDYRLSPAA